MRESIPSAWRRCKHDEHHGRDEIGEIPGGHEFGNVSGLILNTIARSGTNTLHGRGYYDNWIMSEVEKGLAQVEAGANAHARDIGVWLAGLDWTRTTPHSSVQPA